MRKLLRRLMICCMIAAFLWCIDIICGKRKSNECLLRCPAVASSDSPDEPSIKWNIEDRVLASIRQDLATVSDVSVAKDYLKQNIPKIQHMVQKAISENSCLGTADFVLSEMIVEELIGHWAYTVGSDLFDRLRDLE